MSNRDWRSMALWLVDGLLAMAGLAVIVFRDQLRLTDALIGGLSGALLGASAALLSVIVTNWFGARERRRRVQNAQTMVAAELVAVALRLMEATKHLDAAVTSAIAGGTIPTTDNLTSYMPPPMPFTESLGETILELSTGQIDVLATLRSNLATTALQMAEVTAGRAMFGQLRATAIVASVRNDLGQLAEALTEFAPHRHFQLPNGQLELASDVLRRMSRGDRAPF